jgi:hypothetical protein
VLKTLKLEGAGECVEDMRERVEGACVGVEGENMRAGQWPGPRRRPHFAASKSKAVSEGSYLPNRLRARRRDEGEEESAIE